MAFLGHGQRQSLLQDTQIRVEIPSSFLAGSVKIEEETPMLGNCFHFLSFPLDDNQSWKEY
jgi:hypothetical protein